MSRRTVGRLAFAASLSLIAPSAVFAQRSAARLEDLFEAARQNDAVTVARLLGAGFDVNSTDSSGDSLLAIATREGALDVARVLVERRVRVDRRTAAGDLPIMLASLRGHREIVRLLIAAGAEINPEGWTPLHYAASGGHVQICKDLLDAKANIDARSPNGTTPLMMAARQGHLEAVRLLLWEVADPNVINETGATALSLATRANQPAIVTLLRQAGARQ